LFRRNVCVREPRHSCVAKSFSIEAGRFTAHSKYDLIAHFLDPEVGQANSFYCCNTNPLLQLNSFKGLSLQALSTTIPTSSRQLTWRQPSSPVRSLSSSRIYQLRMKRSASLSNATTDCSRMSPWWMRKVGNSSLAEGLGR
jgi:hypothetical protein